jgi:hypothetical protein
LLAAARAEYYTLQAFRSCRIKAIRESSDSDAPVS